MGMRQTKSTSTGALADAPPVRPGRELGYVFALLLFVVGSDLGVVAPLLPGIQKTLSFTLSQAGLLVTVFTAGYTLASPFIGGLIDRLGRRAVLSAGSALFIVFEAISAWAPSYAVLLAGRAMTGVAAAAISPTAYTIIGGASPTASAAASCRSLPSDFPFRGLQGCRSASGFPLT
jgi:predicted MFS family arabinose efflux permease